MMLLYCATSFSVDVRFLYETNLVMLSSAKLFIFMTLYLTRVEAPITNHLRDYVPKNVPNHCLSVKIEACANTIFFLSSFLPSHVVHSLQDWWVISGVVDESKGARPWGSNSNKFNYKGLVQKFHKGIDYVHKIVHVIQFMFSNNLQLSNIEEGLKSFKKEATKRSREESLGQGLQVKIIYIILKICVDYINNNQVRWRPNYGLLAPLGPRKGPYYFQIIHIL